MARYLLQVSYTSDATAKLLSNPQDRGEILREHAQRLGGRIETFDFCFGTYHVATIIEYPDDETMEAITMAIYASGAIKELNITVLSPMDVALRAMTRARAAGYPAPSD